MAFQHGLCGDAAQPLDVFPPDIGWGQLTLECRGHGTSAAGPLDQLSIATFAADLAAAIKSVATAPIVVGGISMGAAIALHLAAHRPELVRALVIARPAWVDTPAPANMAANALAGRLLAELPPDEARQAFMATPVARELAATAPDNLASITSFFNRQPIPVTSALLTRISADGPGVTQAAIRALAIPTLVIGHERDLVHPLADARTLADLIPNAKLVEITPKATDRDRYRAEFRAALAAFLQDLPQ